MAEQLDPLVASAGAHIAVTGAGEGPAMCSGRLRRSSLTSVVVVVVVVLLLLRPLSHAVIVSGSSPRCLSSTAVQLTDLLQPDGSNWRVSVLGIQSEALGEYTSNVAGVAAPGTYLSARLKSDDEGQQQQRRQQGAEAAREEVGKRRGLQVFVAADIAQDESNPAAIAITILNLAVVAGILWRKDVANRRNLHNAGLQDVEEVHKMVIQAEAEIQHQRQQIKQLAASKKVKKGASSNEVAAGDQPEPTLAQRNVNAADVTTSSTPSSLATTATIKLVAQQPAAFLLADEVGSRKPASPDLNVETRSLQKAALEAPKLDVGQQIEQIEQQQQEPEAREPWRGDPLTLTQAAKIFSVYAASSKHQSAQMQNCTKTWAKAAKAALSGSRLNEQQLRQLLRDSMGRRAGPDWRHLWANPKDVDADVGLPDIGLPEIGPHATANDVDVVLNAFHMHMGSGTGANKGDMRVSLDQFHEWLASKGRLRWKGKSVDSYENLVKLVPPTWYLVAVGSLQAVSLPAMTLENLCSRLGQDSQRWRAMFNGGGLVTVLYIWAMAVPVHIAPISPTAAILSLITFFVLLLGVLLIFLHFTAADLEWTDIDEFLDHRTVRFNLKNSLAGSSQLMTLMQLVALTYRVLPSPEQLTGTAQPEELSTYQSYKVGVKKAVDTVLFDFEVIEAPEVDYFLVGFWISCFAVLLWWVLFGGLLLNLAINIQPSTGDASVRYQLYQTLRQSYLPGSYYIFTLLSDTFMISILSNLFRMLDCTYHEETEHWSLDGKPEWDCWASHRVLALNGTSCSAQYDICLQEELDGFSTTSPQPLMATLSMLLMVHYVFSATLLAPFVIADSDGIFQPEQLDIRFAAQFLLIERTLKLSLTGITIFFGEQYPWQVLLVQFNIFVYLWDRTKSSKPCSILWMNSIRSTVFALSAITSLSIIIDVNTQFVRADVQDTAVEWIPFIIQALGLLFIVKNLVASVRIVRRSFGGVKLSRSPVTARRPRSTEQHDKRHTSSEYARDYEFNDAASMRGFSHRLAAVHVRIAIPKVDDKPDSTTDEYLPMRSKPYPSESKALIIGLECEYEMDGFARTTPSHRAIQDEEAMKQDLLFRGEGMWTCRTETLRLKANDMSKISSFTLFYESGQPHSDTAVGIRFDICSTSEGTAKNDFVQRYCGKVDTVVQSEMVAPSSNCKIIAFRGKFGRDGLQDLGAILQRKSLPELKRMEEARQKQLKYTRRRLFGLFAWKSQNKIVPAIAAEAEPGNNTNLKIQQQNLDQQPIEPGGIIKQLSEASGTDTASSDTIADSVELMDIEDAHHDHPQTTTEITTLDDGTRISVFKDGSKKVRHPDNHEEMIFSDGQRQITHLDGREEVFAANGQQHQTKFPDGRQVTRFLQQNELMQIQVSTPDGAVRVIWPDGQMQTTTSDGHTTTKYVDGTTEVEQDSSDHSGMNARQTEVVWEYLDTTSREDHQWHAYTRDEQLELEEAYMVGEVRCNCASVNDAGGHARCDVDFVSMTQLNRSESKVRRHIVR